MTDARLLVVGQPKSRDALAVTGLMGVGPPEEAAAIEQALAGLDPVRFERQQVNDPVAASRSAPGLVLAVVVNEALCAECYRLERSGAKVTVSAGGPLGLQYGVTHWLEALGYGFFHPRHTREPAHFPSEPASRVARFRWQRARPAASRRAPRRRAETE